MHTSNSDEAATRQGPAPAPAMAEHPPLAVTMGDPAGIGPDITLLSWLDRTSLALPPQGEGGLTVKIWLASRPA